MENATSKTRHASAFAGNPVRSGGFSLFELVVFIISVAIIYAYAANRFAEFPREAERANFTAIVTQLQSAISLEMMVGVGTGRVPSAQLMEGINPMDLMLETPVNYLGSFDAVDTSQLPRRTWYFDRQRQELVYLVNDVGGVYLLQNGREVATTEIRFRVVLDYGDIDTRTGLPVESSEIRGVEVPEMNRERRFNGVLMRPVSPYRWEQTGENELIGEVRAQIAG